MTTLPARLRALFQFQFKEPATDWAKGGKTENARLQPAVEKLIAIYEIANRDNKLNTIATGKPISMALDKALADLAALVEEKEE